LSENPPYLESTVHLSEALTNNQKIEFAGDISTVGEVRGTSSCHFEGFTAETLMLMVEIRTSFTISFASSSSSETLFSS